MRVGIAEGAETIVVFLACRIPKRQLHVFSIDLDIGDVVFKDGGHIDLQFKTVRFQVAQLVCRLSAQRAEVGVGGVVGKDDDDGADDDEEQLKRTSGNFPFKNTVNKPVYEQRYISSASFL